MYKESQTTPDTGNTGTELLDSAVPKLTSPSAVTDLKNQTQDTIKGIKDPNTPSKLKPDQIKDPELQGHFEALQNLHAVRAMWNEANTQRGRGGLQAFRQITEKAKARDALNSETYDRIIESIKSNPEVSAINGEAERAGIQLYQSSGLKASFNRAIVEINRKNRSKQPKVRAFNLRKYKLAQTQQSDIDDIIPDSQDPKFLNEREIWINNYLPRLLKNHADRGPDQADFEQIKRELAIEGTVPTAQEEVNTKLQLIRELDPVLEEDTAREVLEWVFDNWINRKEENNMSESNMDLSAQVLNNNDMTKTAADHFGQHYLLYGPSEKRVCPKLRGKVAGGGDIVSEYICRHHCLDGIVIDDNKTVCGEALWRANVMDKYSREYVNADGEIVGGYINKRFEVNRNVPEENKMRLAPGETRKPRPAEWGNTESRLQAMRKAEGEDRGYRPDVNTGDPFVWDKDVDQNNVEVTQAERDKREEAMGHKLVEYTNKDKQENNPKLPNKKAFNLKDFKKEASDPSPTAVPPETKSGKEAFNLQQYKTAQNFTTQGPPIPDDGYADGGEPYDDDEMDLMDGPQEEDIVWDDSQRGPSGYHIVGGKGEIIAKDDESLAQYITNSGFYPNVWHVSDHGNSVLISDRIYPLVNQLEDKKTKPMKAEAEGSNVPNPNDSSPIPDQQVSAPGVRPAFNMRQFKEADKKKRTLIANIPVTPTTQNQTPSQSAGDDVLNFNPEIMSTLFNGDPEQLCLFWDSLEEEEKSIIRHDPKRIVDIFQTKQRDVDSSAKDLEMES